MSTKTKPKSTKHGGHNAGRLSEKLSTGSGPVFMVRSELGWSQKRLRGALWLSKPTVERFEASGNDLTANRHRETRYKLFVYAQQVAIPSPELRKWIDETREYFEENPPPTVIV